MIVNLIIVMCWNGHVNDFTKMWMWPTKVELVSSYDIKLNAAATFQSINRWPLSFVCVKKESDGRNMCNYTHNGL